jgi:hypothetical protein
LFQKAGKYGYEDTKGNEKITAQFDNAYEFFDGLADEFRVYPYHELPLL